MTNGIIIGRFQPWHCNHYKILETALNACDKVYIGIGSANVSGTLKNPMTVFERKKYIQDYITDNRQKPDLLNRIEFIFIDDFMHDNDFFNELEYLIRKYEINYIFGHKKSDGSSNWVNTFYKAPRLNLPVFVDVETGDDTSSTMLRQRVLEGHGVGNYDWTGYREYAKKIKDYNDQFVHPYCNVSTHLTADALIYNSFDNEILLIKRNKGFGSGRYAMIGGFVEPNETCYDAMKRELFEETGIEYDKLKSPPLLIMTVDTPNRSDRGRIYTTVYRISVSRCDDNYWDNLNNLNSIISNFKANDEVSELRWVTRKDFNESVKYQMLEDHAVIISSLTGF